jgi:hypothetical protein
VNNVLFNYRHRTVDGGDHRSFFNIINNTFKPGPGTPNTEVAYRILKPESERSKTVINNFGKAYVSGNVVEGNARVTQNNWDGGVQPSPVKTTVAAVLPAIRVDQPFGHAPLEVVSAAASYGMVLDHAGATLPRRDAVDTRVAKMVRTGVVTPATITESSKAKAAQVGYAQKWIDEMAELVPRGFITNPAEVGGYPIYAGKPYIDTDGDGMPDEWEIKNGLDPKNPADATGDLNGDGYTNIEKFIYGLNPRAPKTDWTDLRNNRDPLMSASATDRP